AVPDCGVGVMACLGIVPVGHEDGTVRAGAELDGTEVGVVGDEEILTVAADVGGAVLLEDIRVDAIAVDVVHQDAAVPLLRVGPALVDEACRMGMAAADRETSRVLVPLMR